MNELEILTQKAMFLMQLRRSLKATQLCFRFSERFCFCSTDYAVNFFTKSHCHSCLFCRERVILVSYFGLPLSYNQNTEQDTLPCSKVSSKNKQNISLHSFPFFFSSPPQIRCNRYQIQEEQTLILKEGATVFFIEHCRRNGKSR